jgi:hypothetical protein
LYWVNVIMSKALLRRASREGHSLWDDFITLCLMHDCNLNPFP